MKRKIFAGAVALAAIVLSIILIQGIKSEPVPEEISTLTDTTPLRRSINAFDSYLQQNLDSSQTVGAAATIVYKDSVVFMRTSGVRRAGAADPVTPHTVFRLASVSKGFTGVLALLLEKEGLLSIQDPVRKYITGFQLKDSVNTADLNIHHLLNHTSGLVPHAYDNLAEAGLEIGEILPRFAEVDISAPPGELYGYQNVLFSLFDTIASQISGEDFSLLLQEKIFLPLGMQDASAGFDKLVWHPDVAFPHIRTAGGYRVLPMHTGYYNLMPAAGINASISDMCRWLLALLGHVPEILGTELLETIATPQIYTPLKRNYTRYWEKIDGRHYSFGWRIYDYKGRRIIYHGGYVRGYQAEIAFCPQEEIGLAFLQNSPNRLASQCIPAFFDMLFTELDKPKAPSARYSGN